MSINRCLSLYLTKLFLYPLILVLVSNLICKAQAKSDSKKYNAYLFAYFTGNEKSEEAIRFAISTDGFNYTALNQNEAILNSDLISSSGGVRDPHILRGVDGKTFYMVATDMVSAKGWNSNRAMVLLKSNDLIHWTSTVINIQKRFSNNQNLLRVWAPQTIYDKNKGKYMVYWSMKHGNDQDKIYYAYVNKSFTDFETVPKQLFYSPDNGACIDAEIVFHKGMYHLFYKTEGAAAGINIATSKKLTEGYKVAQINVQQSEYPVEGAGVFKLNSGNDYVLMYDVYTKGKYQFTKSSDFKHFTVIDQEVSMNFHPRHGTIMPITNTEAKRLINKWLSVKDVISSVQNPEVKKRNIYVDTTNRSLFLSIKPGIDTGSFKLRFRSFPGVNVSYFKADSVKKPDYVSVTIPRKKPERYAVRVNQSGNPVLDGYYADPDILYSEKYKKFYIYPTSDGFAGWSGTSFKSFSSNNLITWKDEGVILDLERDVTWAKKNAWAPSIIEKKVNGIYKYFFYFTAAQKIGVAVSDNPTGPFKDTGKPLIANFPEGIDSGQQIDPDVFTDPKTGKSYLYWGNGYMAGAELNEDMVSLKPGTTKILTPDKEFREGTSVFYRNGKYYFTWSENDTRSPDYKVAYGIARSPLGPITIPSKNVILQKNNSAGIYATGHNSTLQIPGTDKWYIIYHRFNYPNGINMGDAAGYYREVCIDQMTFDAEGNIIEVIPTHQGVLNNSNKQ